MPSTSMHDGGFGGGPPMPPQFLWFVVIIWGISLFGILFMALYYGL